MNTKQVSWKKNKTPGRFLLGQILLCVLIITSIVFFGNMIYRDDLKHTKQIRLDAEVDTMREIITNTIIRIDAHRQITKDRVTELINVCSESAASSGRDPIKSTKHVLEAAGSSEAGRSIHLKGSKILLVEDNDLNREIAAAILEEMNVQVEEAENGKVAVEMIRSSTPDTMGWY